MDIWDGSLLAVVTSLVINMSMQTSLVYVDLEHTARSESLGS